VHAHTAVLSVKFSRGPKSKSPLFIHAIFLGWQSSPWTTWWACHTYDVSHDRKTQLSNLFQAIVGHTADVDVVEWHPTCNYIATGSSDRSVRMWDAVSGAPIRIFLGLRSPVRTSHISVPYFVFPWPQYDVNIAVARSSQ
jgi:WD40 repeat protein